MYDVNNDSIIDNAEFNKFKNVNELEDEDNNETKKKKMKENNSLNINVDKRKARTAKSFKKDKITDKFIALKVIQITHYDEKIENHKRDTKITAIKDKEKMKDNARKSRDSFLMSLIKKFKFEYIFDSENEKISNKSLNINFKRFIDAVIDYFMSIISVIKKFRKVVSEKNETALTVIRMIRVKHNDFLNTLKVVIANIEYDILKS